MTDEHNNTLEMAEQHAVILATTDSKSSRIIRQLVVLIRIYDAQLQTANKILKNFSDAIAAEESNLS